VKLLADSQVLDCELLKNAFGDRAPPGPAGGGIALPIPTICYKGEKEGKKGLEIERIGGGKGRT